MNTVTAVRARLKHNLDQVLLGIHASDYIQGYTQLS